MRWPWARRAHRDGIVWTVLALRRHGAPVFQLAHDTGYSYTQVVRSLVRLEDKGCVDSRLEGVEGAVLRVWFVSEEP